MADTITLTREEPTSTYSGAAQHSWGLKVTAVSNKEGLGSKVFVYQENAPGSGYSADRFSCVASTQQMQDLPEDGPTDDGDSHVPFYRVATAEFDCRSPELREEIWEKIKTNVNDLLVNWLALEETEETETVVIGE